MRRFWSSLIAVVAVAAILIGVNMLADAWLANVQLDLTQQHLYTLSRGTRQVLRGLKEPVTLRLFYSPQLGGSVPAYGAYADRVRELLRQYATVARGKIRLEFYDPEPFSDVEDRAIGYGLKGVPVDRSDEQVYFGLAGSNLLDDERILPFFQPARERFLEYDLTRLVYDLSNPTRPVVGVMSSLPLEGDEALMRQEGTHAPWMSVLQFRQAFTVQDVPLDTQVIDPSVQALLVAHAQHLGDATLYAIDQFVMRGGRLMVMVDPHSEAEAAEPDPSGAPPQDTASNLAKLFDAWGIAFDPDVVVGDLSGAWRVRANASDRPEGVDYVAWFNIRDGIDHDDPATADIAQVTVASAGALAKQPGAAIEFTPLLSSSNESATFPAERVRAMPDPAKLLAEFKPEGGPRVIAARVRGLLKSAFSGPPAPPANKPRPDNFPPYKAGTDGPANLVVVADSDILADFTWVRLQDFYGQQEATPLSDNGAFVTNLLDTLAGSGALLGLRGRGSSLRPFTLVDEMQRRAEARFRQTEQALQTHLDETQKQLTQLRSGGSDAEAPVLTNEQRIAIDGLQRDITATRARLRAVQLDLRHDIAGLETTLRLFTIVLVPAMLTLLAIALGLVRRRHRARARA
jgi:ABC-type uncharacterized transport system involved in gliding motility auxiliary subunit